MFLRHRAMQAEYFDGNDRTPDEIGAHYRALERLNQLTRFERPFRLWIPNLLGEAACQRLRILDLGSGNGQLGRVLTAWAAERGWVWEFTNLDLCPYAAELDPGNRHVVGSVTRLPFGDQAFDVVVATTMTHHLPSELEVIEHFSEAGRVAGRLVLLCDLHRNLLFQMVLWCVCLGESKPFRSDAVLSIRRGWRVGDWRRLAQSAGLVGAKVWLEHGTRVLLSFTKENGLGGGVPSNTTSTNGTRPESVRSC